MDDAHRHGSIDDLKNLTNKVFQCLRCISCKATSLDGGPDLLHGLCSKHIICSNCAKTADQRCPACKNPLKRSYLEATLAVAPAILSTLNDIKKWIELPLSDESGKEDVGEGAIINNAGQNTHSKEATPRVRATPSLTVRKKHNKVTSKGENLFYQTVLQRDLSKIKAILEEGARCNVKDYAGSTPLFEMVQNNEYGVCELLLQHGADPNIPDAQGNTALHEAAVQNSKELLKLLMEYGGDPTKINLTGVIPKDLTTDAECTFILSKPPKVLQTPITTDPVPSAVELLEERITGFVAGTGLDAKQLALMTRVTKLLRYKKITPPVKDLHVVVTGATNGVCKISVAALNAILVGAWLVTPEWLVACEKNSRIVDPEPFEVIGIEGYKRAGAPKIARLHCKSLLLGLFSGCRVFIHPAMKLEGDLSVQALGVLVQYGGGTPISRSPNPEDDTSSTRDLPLYASRDGSLRECSNFIIYQPDDKRAPKVRYNMKHLKSLTVSWLLDCMINFKLYDPLTSSQ